MRVSVRRRALTALAASACLGAILTAAAVIPAHAADLGSSSSSGLIRLGAGGG
jgi:hypothetical protein